MAWYGLGQTHKGGIMNEQIKQLAQQSKLAELYDRYVEQCMKNADDDILDYDVIVKEFAESIVRECIDIAKNWEDQLENANSLSESNAVGIVAYRIARQFGVKE